MSFIKVTPPSRQAPTYDGQNIFYLQQDNWNDFSFRTQYHLYFYDTDAAELVLAGTVKILKTGQRDVDPIQIAHGFEYLGPEFCSLGQELDYYERLGKLGAGIRKALLIQLRDCLQDPSIWNVFRNEEGWSTSLFRFVREEDDWLELARALLMGGYTTLPEKDLCFSFKMTDWDVALDFDFAPVSGADRSLDKYLPGNLAVVVGSNGAGKSTFLARLARVAHAPGEDRSNKVLKRLGTISPPGIGFPRILTFSYSAFDSFELPGLTRGEREQIVKDVERGEGRFLFCGLRDIALELRLELERTQSTDEPEAAMSIFSMDRRHQTLLKPIDKVAAEFAKTLRHIQNRERDELLQECLDILYANSGAIEPSPREIVSLCSLSEGEAVSTFMCWSSGHKVVMQIVASLVAYTEPRSLVLIDEPEAHLHPPLLAGLMHAVRRVLRYTKSFAIVATHSPVVVQETAARHVRVMRRDGPKSCAFRTSIETFGENIGTITEEVFGLNSAMTDYHTTIGKMAEVAQSLQELDGAFPDHGLSMQARAYAMTLMAAQKQGR